MDILMVTNPRKESSAMASLPPRSLPTRQSETLPFMVEPIRKPMTVHGPFISFRRS